MAAGPARAPPFCLPWSAWLSSASTATGRNWSTKCRPNSRAIRKAGLKPPSCVAAPLATKNFRPILIQRTR